MERHSLRRFYGRQIFKGALFASTALVLPAIAPRPALAQISPSATPTGGVVVGGSATIAQAPASTTITQASQLAAINWQSFNVGSAAKVQFNQPNASAVALNRVTGGNLSQINGQINANGQIVLINQSGVVFGKGSQVNAESVVVSTSDIATSDFMAGRMNFTGAPHPGAKIINDGNITARNAGLVGLVAPQVANNGVITAQLGQVVLAGASAFTLDLYGDRLISLDVTQAVRAVDVNGQLVPALVTNSGVILADGGKVTLTAQDADALVTQLITAGGTIRANNAGNATGAISVTGVGGNISIAGNLLAQGTTPGAKGGAIQALATGTVTVAPTAVIDASGNAGGGYAAIGTTLTRAQTGPSDTTAPAAAVVTIAQGAAIRADATAIGNGGTVTVLSQNTTSFQGAISAQGGPQGGNGGLAEISSHGVINLGGTVDDLAINGKPGEILLDPATITIVTGGGTTTTGSQIAPSYLDSLSGNIVISASSLLEVLSDVRMSISGTALTLQSGANVSIGAFISVNGSLEIDAGNSIVIGPSATMGSNGNFTFTDTGGIIANNALFSAASGIDIGANIQIAPGGTLALQSPGGPIAESTIPAFLGATATTVSGIIQTGILTGDLGSIGGNLILNNPANAIDTLANVSTVNGIVDVADAASLFIEGNAAATAATFASSGDVSVQGFVSLSGSLEIDAAGAIYIGPSFSVNGGNNIFSDTGGLAAGNAFLSANSAGGINIGADVQIASPGTIAMESPNGPIIESQIFGTANANPTIVSGIIQAATLTGNGSETGGNLFLTNTANAIGTIENFSTVKGAITLDDAASLTLLSSLIGTNVYIDLAQTRTLNFEDQVVSATATGGTVSVVADALANQAANSLFAPAGTIQIAPATAAKPIDIDSIAGANPLILNAADFGNAKTVIFGNGANTGGIALGSIGNQNFGNETVELFSQGAAFQTQIFTAGTLEIFTGGFNQIANGEIDVDTILGTVAGAILIPGLSNSFNTIGGLSATSLISLYDNPLSDLTLNGLIAAPSVTIQTGGPTEGLTEGAAGQIDTTMITTGAGLIGGGVTLGNTNAIQRLAAFNAGGDILLNNSGTLQITGLVHTPTALTLEDDAAITENGGYIQAATLTSDGSDIGGNVSLGSNQNAIGTIANFLLASTDSFNLIDSAALNVAGTVTAGNIALSAPQITLASGVSAGSLLDLIGATAISQTAGSITAGTLAGSLSFGDISLTAATNSFGTLGALTATNGDIFLADRAPTQIIGSIFTPGELQLSLTALSETSTGIITAATLDNINQLSGFTLANPANSIGTLAGDYDIGAGGGFALFDKQAIHLATLISATGVSFGGAGITEITGGLIDTPTLGGAGNITGNVILANANSIGNIAALTLTGALDVNDIASIDLGDISAHTATLQNANASDNVNIGGFVSLAGALDFAYLDGTLAGSGSLAAATLLLTNGPIDYLDLRGGNAIATLAGIDDSGNFDLNDLVTLNIAGNLTAQNILLAAPTILLNSPVDAATSGTLAIITDNVISGPSGVFSVPSGTFEIASQSASQIDVGGAGGAGTLGLPGTIFPLTASEIIIGDALGHQAQSIAIDSGNFGTGLLILSATNGITDNGALIAGDLEFDGGGFIQAGPSAAITANSVSADGPVTGLVSLASTRNQLGQLGPITVTNADLIVNDGDALTIAGALNADNIALSDTSDISIAAPVSVATGGTIQLAANAFSATAAISAPSGTVIISPDSPGATTPIDLGGTSNGGLTLADTLLNLIAAGILRLGTLGGGEIYAEGSVSISEPTLILTGSAVDFTGTLNGDANLLSLASAGNISESPGAVLTFATILGDGAIIGLGGQNTFGTIGNFTATGNLHIDAFASTVIAGIVSSPGTISLQGDFYTETANGGLQAVGLASSGTIGGNVILESALNKIGTLAGFAIGAGDTFALNDSGEASGLIIAGPFTAPNATLAAPSLQFAGTVTDATLLALQTTGGITQSTGTIAAGALTSLGSIGGNVTLTGQNAIATLENFILAAGHSLALTDASALTLAETNIAPIATLTAAGITFAGTFDSSTELFLAGNGFGNVTETTGLINTGTLAGAGLIRGAISLLSANSFGTIGALGATGNIALNDSASLAIGGQVSTTGTISLQATGNVDEITGGELDAAALTTGAGSIGGNVTLGGNNNVATLEDFYLASGGTLSLLDSGPLTIAGTVSAPNAFIGASALAFTGLLHAQNILGLYSAGTISQTTGAIVTGALVSNLPIGGNVFLLGTNTIATLGAFSVATGHTFALDDNSLLTVTGPLNATSISLSSGAITIAGAITSTLLNIAATGNVTESAGVIDTGTLTTGTGLIDGLLSLPNQNSIGTLGALDASNGILLNDQQPLAIAGLVATANAITLEGAGGITETTGAISAATLNTGAGTLAGNIQLGNANTINVLGNTTLAASGNFYLNDTGLLTVNGTFFAPTATFNTGSLSIQGALDATYLALGAAGTIAEAAGVIGAATLASDGTVGAAVTLLGNNAIATLSAFTGAAAISLFDGQDLTIDGFIRTPSALILEGPASIREIAGGAIAAATLTSAETTIGGNLLLANANTIGAIGALTIGNGNMLALTDTGLLTVSGTVAALIATISAPTIAIAGALNAAALALQSAGNVYETGAGTIGTGTLSTGSQSIAGFLSLQNANLIATTGNIDVLGNILIDDTENLAINSLIDTPQTLTLEGTSNISEGPTGLIDATGLTTNDTALIGNVTLNNQNTIATLSNAILAAGDTLALTDTEILTLAGNINISFTTYTAPGVVDDGFMFDGNILALTSATSVIEGVNGTIIAGTLTSLGSIDGDVILNGAGNTIGTIVNFTVGTGDTFELTDTGLLTVAGPLTGTYVTLAVPTIAIPGLIEATELSLQDGAGGISETTGRITAATLDSGGVTLTGPVSLTGANTIGTIGNLAFTGNFALANHGPLIIAGALATPTGDVTLEDNASITETTGIITAATLDTGGTSIGGNLLLQNNNAIASLGGIALAAGGTLALTDPGALTIAGTISAPTATFTAGTLAIAGAIDGTALTLLNDGAVSETTGTISEATLATGAGTIASLAFLQHNLIGTLGPIAAAGDIAINDATALAIGALVTTAGAITLEDSSSITELAAGGLDAAALTSANTTIGGALLLLGQNKIATIGPLAATGAIALNDSKNAAITDLISTQGALSFEGAAPTETSTGIIHAGELTSIGALNGNTTLANTANAIASLTSFTANGGFFLADSTPLAITGLVHAETYLGLNDQSDVTETGDGAISAPLFTTDSGAIAGNADLTGANTIGLISGFTAASFILTDKSSLIFDFGIDIANSLIIQDTGNVTQPDGIITAATLSTGAGSIGGNAIFAAPDNKIGTLANFVATGGLNLADSEALNLAGNIDTSNAGLTLNDPNQNITQTGGAITTGLLTVYASNLAFTFANNINALGNASVANNLNVTGVRNISGSVFATNAVIGGNGNTGLTLSGNIDTSNNLTLQSAGPFYESAASSLKANNAYIGVSNTNPAAGSAILSGFSSVSNGFYLNASGAITQTGGSILGGVIEIVNQTGDLIQYGSAAIDGQTISLSNLTDGSTLGIAGTISAATALNLVSAGALTDNAQSLSAANASFQGVNILLGGNNTIAGALNVTGTGAGYGIDLTGNLIANTASLSTSNINGGGILLSGNLSAATQLNLSSATNINQSTGLIAAPTANIAAGGNIGLNGNSKFTASLTATATGAISQSSGNIVAPTATLKALHGDITLNGGAQIANILDLLAPHGNIVHNAEKNLLSAGTLEGLATNFASFTAPTHIATLGSFILTDSTFALDNTGALTIIGPVVADAISIIATGALTLDGSPTGGLFIDGADDPKTQLTPQSGDSVLEVTQATDGAMPEIIQTGTFFINAGPEAALFPSFANQPGTVFFIGTPNANLAFTQAPPDDAGLNAPSIAIDLDLGPAGTGSGNANLYSLTILSGASVSMNGSIDGVGGAAGAGKGNAEPFAKPAYQFNACPIGSVNCVIIPVETIPSNNPLQNFDIGQRKRKRLDKNVALPGVAIRDF